MQHCKVRCKKISDVPHHLWCRRGRRCTACHPRMPRRRAGRTHLGTSWSSARPPAAQPVVSECCESHLADTCRLRHTSSLFLVGWLGVHLQQQTLKTHPIKGRAWLSGPACHHLLIRYSQMPSHRQYTQDQPSCPSHIYSYRVSLPGRGFGCGHALVLSSPVARRNKPNKSLKPRTTPYCKLQGCTPPEPRVPTHLPQA